MLFSRRFLSVVKLLSISIHLAVLGSKKPNNLSMAAWSKDIVSACGVMGRQIESFVKKKEKNRIAKAAIVSFKLKSQFRSRNRCIVNGA
jgi:hypothetical protein